MANSQAHLNVSLKEFNINRHFNDSSESDNDEQFKSIRISPNIYILNEKGSLQVKAEIVPKPGQYWASPPPPSIKTVRGEKQRYWKINFIIVLLPLLSWGMPVHLFLFGRRGINSTKSWLKQIFLKDNIFIRILTYFFFTWSLFVNCYFLKVSVSFFWALVIKGVITYSTVEDLFNMLRLAPVVIPLNLAWLWGYSIRKLLLSFDRVTYPEIEVQAEDIKKKWKDGWRNMPFYRVRLLGIYLLVLFNQAIHFITQTEFEKKYFFEDNTLGALFTNRIGFWLNFMYNSLLPIYIVLCWAVQFEFERLSLYIKSLIECKVHPDVEYLVEIKKYYKQVANHVVQINDICSPYYSWVILFLYTSLYKEMYGVLQVLLVSFVVAVFSGQKADMTAPEIRLLMGNLFGAIFQLVLLGLLVWFCITANDQARQLHVRLNDFVSEPYVTLTPDLYKKFRMVKYYIHSRMETENPALLSVYVINLMPYGSCLNNWMNNYRVRH